MKNDDLNEFIAQIFMLILFIGSEAFWDRIVFKTTECVKLV